MSAPPPPSDTDPMEGKPAAVAQPAGAASSLPFALPGSFALPRATLAGVVDSATGATIAATAQAFASRPISSAMHTPTCPFRHISAQLAQFQECACQGPAIRLKTQREAEIARIQKELDSIVPPEGCPIAQQPVTLLALVCRCLNARDLVSTFKTCRQLCSAAQHPLTFQHGVGYLVDTSTDRVGSCKGVRSFGPNAVCGTLSELETAMTSRLFKSFRILTLNTPNPHHMAQMMAALGEPAAPHLHSLALVCDSKLVSDSEPVPVLASFPSMQYLKTLSVQLPPYLESALSTLPPRLEVLQMICTTRHAKRKKGSGASSLLPPGITEALRPLQYLKHLICKPHEQPPKSHGGRMQKAQAIERTTLGDLLHLAEISQTVPQLESIGWFVPLDHDALLAEMKLAFQANPDAAPPTVRKLTQLRMTSLLYDSGTTPCDVLTCFPQLTEVRFAKAEIVSFATSPGLYPRWNPSLARGLIELRVDSMAPAFEPQRAFGQQGMKASAFLPKGSNLIPSTNAVLVAQLTGAQLSSLQKLTIVGAETRDAAALAREWERLMRSGDKLDRMIQKPAVPMPVDLASMLQTMPQLRYLSIAQFELPDFNAFKYAPQLTTLKGVSWPESVRDVPDDPRDLISCFPSLTSLSVASSPSLDDRTAFHYRGVLMTFPALRSVTWKREKPIHPSNIEAHYKESEVARVQALLKREQLEREAAERSKQAHEAAMAMHKAGLAPLTEEQSWYKGGELNSKNTVQDMEDVSKRLRAQWEATKKQEAAAEAAAVAVSAAGPAQPAFSMDSLSSQFSLASFDSMPAGVPASVSAPAFNPPGAFQLGPDAAKPAAARKSRVSGGGAARHSTTPAKSTAAPSFSTPPPQQGAGGFGSFSFTSPSTQPAANALMSFAAAGSAPPPFGVSSAPFAFSTPPAAASQGSSHFGSPAQAPGAPGAAPAFVFNVPQSFVFHAPGAAKPAGAAAPAGTDPAATTQSGFNFS